MPYELNVRVQGLGKEVRVQKSEVRNSRTAGTAI